MNEVLEEYFGKACLYLYQGSQAIYLYLQSFKGKEIALPNILCPEVYVACVKAGLKIRLIDVNLDDYTISLSALKDEFGKKPFDIILLAHIYGHLCDDKIYDFAQKNGVYILEDAAQSYKINLKADASIMSFGHTKFLENPGGGGALFTKNINKYQKILASFSFSKNIANPEDFRRKYYELKARQSPVGELYLNNFALYKGRVENPFLLKKLKTFKASLKNREEMMSKYASLSHPALLHPRLRQQSIAWRYTARFTKDRDKLLAFIRKRGLPISSWYEGLDRVFGIKGCFDASRVVEKEVINLWLDEQAFLGFEKALGEF